MGGRVLGVCLTLVRQFLARGDTIMSGEGGVSVCAGEVLRGDVSLVERGFMSRVWVVWEMLW